MTKLKIFFDARMVAYQGSASPSSHKPAEIVAYWQNLHSSNIQLETVAPATFQQIALAHDLEYVRNILACKEDNGFGERSLAVAESLPWAVGAMIGAARSAYHNRVNTCAPVSGFHHAGWESACGFCTFNGLMVAARVLLQEGAKRVGILDCDMHYGNGTDDILDHVLSGSTPSGAARANVHANGNLEAGGVGCPIRHYTFGEHYEGVHSSTRPRYAAQHFLENLPNVVQTMADCDVILYQAGADPHVDDPYGGCLTDADLAERDDTVFRMARDLGVPVAWNLAGGYRKDALGGITPVLETHTTTLKACLASMRGAEKP